ncbi:MAG: hypothetical protein AAFY26_13830 [Cyanobacteria bacterium J06638_22]
MEPSVLEFSNKTLMKFSISEMADAKPWWESASVSIGAILVPITVAFVGSLYSAAVKSREIEGQFVGIAVNILQEEPTESTQPLRTWAVSVINEYSGVPMEQAARENLIEREALPARLGIVRSGSGIGINVRSGPGYNYPPVAGIDDETMIRIVPGSETVVDGETWVLLEGGGWVITQFLVQQEP